MAGSMTVQVKEVDVSSLQLDKHRIWTPQAKELLLSEQQQSFDFVVTFQAKGMSRVSFANTQGPSPLHSKRYWYGFPWLSLLSKRVNDAVIVEAAALLVLSFAAMTQNNTDLVVFAPEVRGKPHFGGCKRKTFSIWLNVVQSKVRSNVSLSVHGEVGLMVQPLFYRRPSVCVDVRTQESEERGNRREKKGGTRKQRELREEREEEERKRGVEREGERDRESEHAEAAHARATRKYMHTHAYELLDVAEDVRVYVSVCVLALVLVVAAVHV